MAAAPPQFLSASVALRPKRGMSVIGASVSGSWTKSAIQPPRRRRCPLVALIVVSLRCGIWSAIGAYGHRVAIKLDLWVRTLGEPSAAIRKPANSACPRRHASRSRQGHPVGGPAGPRRNRATALSKTSIGLTGIARDPVSASQVGDQVEAFALVQEPTTASGGNRQATGPCWLHRRERSYRMGAAHEVST